MNYFTKERIIIWSIIILVVMNIVTISVMWSWKKKNVIPVRYYEHPINEREKRMECYLKDQYDFSDMQIKSFIEYKNRHFTNSSGLLDEIRQLKDQIHAELFKETPDTNKVNALIDQIGGKYGEVMRLNFHHFMELQSMFPDETQEKYKLFMQDIIDRMDQCRPYMPKEKMRRNRHRH